jgi:RNA polymerase sigma-70 factor (ECF subfamily)
MGDKPAEADRRGYRRVERIRARLQEAMESLPEKSRLVLLLTSMDGHSLEEVAEVLQLPLGTVKSRLHSARKQLAEKLR